MPNTKTVWLSRYNMEDGLEHATGIPIDMIFTDEFYDKKCTTLCFYYEGPSKEAMSFVEKHESRYLSASLYCCSGDKWTYKIFIAKILPCVSTDMMLVEINVPYSF